MDHSFKKLKYSFANEDSTIERASAVRFRSVLSVGGSGSRAFSVIHPELRHLVIVDESAAQIEFIKFKWELIKKLTREQYLKFMGYLPAEMDERLDIIESIELSVPSVQYYRNIPERCVEAGIVYCGQWEANLISIGKFLTTFMIHDFRENFEERMDSGTHWPKRRLRAFLGLLCNPLILNRFLFSVKNLPSARQSVQEFLIQNIETLFLKGDPKSSFFHQMLFLDHVAYPEGLPIDVSADVFEQIKRYDGLVEFHVMSLDQAVKKFDFEFGSFSRVPSELKAAEAQILERLLTEKLRTGLKKVIMRSFCYEHRICNEELRHTLDPGAAEFARHRDSTGLYRFQIVENS